MATERDVVAFARLVEALRPQLTRLVFIGGWAHRLHRLHPYAQHLEYGPLMTRDADVALPLNAFAEEDIRQQLVAAKFQERFVADYRPPVTRYELGEDAGGFFAEFLTPLTGGENRRLQPRCSATFQMSFEMPLLREEMLAEHSNRKPFGRSAAPV